jgi:virginiamycin B lyase
MTTYRPELSSTQDGVVALNGGGAFFFNQANASSGYGSGALVAIASEGGQVRQYMIPTKDYIQSVAIGPDGTMWATTILDDSSARLNLAWHSAIVRLTEKRLITAFRIPARLGYASALVVAPDGAFWFALPDAHAVGKSTQRGKITVTVLPRTIKPDILALDSYGYLYVTQSGQRTIFRLSPDGNTRTLTSAAEIGSLAAGPHNEVWFTETGSNRVARVTQSGKIEEVDVGPVVVSDAIAISNDSVWFATRGSIGRLSLRDRTSRIIPLPDRRTFPQALAVSRSGIIWVAEEFSDWRCMGECGGMARIVP